MSRSYDEMCRRAMEPRPEFKVGDWVETEGLDPWKGRIGEVNLAQGIYWVVERTLLNGRTGWFYASELTPCARPFRVGDRVIDSDGDGGKILCIHGDEAWINYECGRATEFVNDLEHAPE